MQLATQKSAWWAGFACIESSLLYVNCSQCWIVCLCQLFTQEQVEEMKKKEERLEKKMADVSTENNRLVEPLQKAKNDVAELQRNLANYEKDKQLLAVNVLCAVLIE